MVIFLPATRTHDKLCPWRQKSERKANVLDMVRMTAGPNHLQFVITPPLSYESSWISRYCMFVFSALSKFNLSVPLYCLANAQSLHRLCPSSYSRSHSLLPHCSCHLERKDAVCCRVGCVMLKRCGFPRKVPNGFAPVLDEGPWRGAKHLRRHPLSQS